MAKQIAIIGEYDPKKPTHVATNSAIEHARSLLGVSIEGQWISSEEVTSKSLEEYTGFLIAPGSPYKNMSNVLGVIKYAREHGVPCLGTCGGFQHIILEYARNVLGFLDAAHAECDPYALHLFIIPFSCSLAGRQMTIQFKMGSKIADIYGTSHTTENYYCNFGINPQYISLFQDGALKITGSDTEGDMRIVELEGHPFFIGTLFVPQSKSKQDNPHPIITAFLKAGLEYQRKLEYAVNSLSYKN